MNQTEKDLLNAQLAAVENQLETAKSALELQMIDKHLLLSNVSHEVQTPVLSIIRMLELLSASEMNIEQKDLVLTLINSGKRLDTLISDILDYSRVQQGRLVLQSKPTHVRHLVEQSARLFAEKASEKQIELVCHYHSDCPDYFDLDGPRLVQILNNILSNAFKFSAQGTVSIQVNFQNEALHIAICDEGIGMSSQTLNQIKQSIQKPTAIGLGSFMYLRLIDLMRGTLDISSVLGTGTKVQFSLPVTLSDIEQKPAGPCDFSHALLLVNNPLLCQNLSDYVSKIGLQVTALANTAALKDYIESEQPFDCIIANATDLEPGTLFWLAKKSKHNFLLTPYGSNLDTGFFNSVLKPVAFDELQTLIQTRKTPHNRIRQELSNLTLNKPMMQILLAEDDEANIKLARTILQPLDADIVVATDGRKAFELYCDEYFHVVLISRHLPIKDGLVLTQQIKEYQREQKRPVPIIGLLPNSSHQQRFFCIESGMDEVIEKPFNYLELVQSLNKLCR